MLGIIHLELRKFVETRDGPAAWGELLVDAGLPGELGYDPRDQYPDDEMNAVIAAAARRTGRPAAAVLEDFGEFVAPHLLTLYPNLIRPEWRTLDFLVNTERAIHQVVRLNSAEARPAFLRCVRPMPDEVVLSYSSPRRLCAFARGLVKGVARHYRERVAIMEITCMHRGAPACTMSVRLQGAAP
jgi:hypothetical protein